MAIFDAMKKPFYDRTFRLGILGGGQLGRMFIQEAVNYNLAVHVLDPDPYAPCRDWATSFTQGSFADYDTVIAFGEDMDVLTIEIEHVNVGALRELEKRGVHVYPQPDVLEVVQDKGLQKQFYRDRHIPTAPFELVESAADIRNHLDQFPWMQKLRKGGYDGKGVTPLRTESDLRSAFDAPSVLEKWVDLDKEISVIVARGESAEVTTFPSVELAFNPEANLVEFLFSPAVLTSEQEEEAQRLARKLADSLGIVGILAVEMFLTRSGEILVNEIAPRPHNSGHQSIEGNYTSQYEQHLRAIVGLPLGNTALVHPSVMVNLLGEKGHTGDATIEGWEAMASEKGVYLHLYGKRTTKPFRKMGHVTVLNPDLEEAKRLARLVKETVKIKAL